ncbi:MAG: hypothetical protein PVH18_07370 [Chloroflexota bacterium]|jgi:hypothetical protein
MLKHKRTILFAGAILALVALAGLSLVAFAQGEAESSEYQPLSGASLGFLDGERAALALLDPTFQEPPADQATRPFLKQRMRQNLAEALGISPEALDDARWAAFLATLEDAVAEGYLTQQMADRRVAQALIRQTTSREQLIAAGLGITVEELQAAHEAGTSVRQLVDDMGLDATTIGQNLATFLEDLLLQAADDDLIGDQQAQRILEDEFLDRLARGLWRPWLQPHRPLAPRIRR